MTDQLEPEAVAPPPTEDWRTDKAGKEYTPRLGARGVVYRHGQETVAQALERDAKPRTGAPRRKAKLQKPPPPAKADLKELEHELAEVLRQPAIFAGMAGDEFVATHITNAAPVLARNVVIAAEHNPWLRRKLEEMASGADITMKVMSVAGVAGAFVAYIGPVVLYYFPQIKAEGARKLWEIPDRRTSRVADFPPPSAQAAAA